MLELTKQSESSLKQSNGEWEEEVEGWIEKVDKSVISESAS